LMKTEAGWLNAGRASASINNAMENNRFITS
jgi:hypothetical protein